MRHFNKSQKRPYHITVYVLKTSNLVCAIYVMLVYLNICLILFWQWINIFLNLKYHFRIWPEKLLVNNIHRRKVKWLKKALHVINHILMASYKPFLIFLCKFFHLIKRRYSFFNIKTCYMQIFIHFDSKLLLYLIHIGSN